MAWIRLCLGVLLLSLLAGEETVQIFVDADGNDATGYGAEGIEFVIREAVNEEWHGAGGWGSAIMECYSDDELVCSYPCQVDLTCCTPDLNLDGNVDLADFALFQEAFGYAR